MQAARLIVLIWLSALLVGCAREENLTDIESIDKPVQTVAIASTKQLMQVIVMPTSDVVFAVAGETPKDDAAWFAVQNNAMVLAETGNLLILGARRVDTEKWTDFSHQLTVAAKNTAQAAAEKDPEKVSAAGNVLYEVCDGCHKQYMADRAGE